MHNNKLTEDKHFLKSIVWKRDWKKINLLIETSPRQPFCSSDSIFEAQIFTLNWCWRDCSLCVMLRRKEGRDAAKLEGESSKKQIFSGEAKGMSYPSGWCRMFLQHLLCWLARGYEHCILASPFDQRLLARKGPVFRTHGQILQLSVEIHVQSEEIFLSSPTEQATGWKSGWNKNKLKSYWAALSLKDTRCLPLLREPLLAPCSSGLCWKSLRSASFWGGLLRNPTCSRKRPDVSQV